jgi:hypothetical protein
MKEIITFYYPSSKNAETNNMFTQKAAYSNIIQLRSTSEHIISRFYIQQGNSSLALFHMPAIRYSIRNG